MTEFDNSKNTERHSAWPVPFTHRKENVMSPENLSRRTILAGAVAAQPPSQ